MTLVVVMAIGFGVVLAGALADRTRRRARERELTAPPDRPIPGLDEGTRPAYVDARTALRTPEGLAPTTLDAGTRTSLEVRTRAVTPVRARLVDKRLLTDPAAGWAVLDEPRVLLCAEPVETFREVLGVVGAHDPLVVVAPAYATEVRDTLVANSVQRLHRLVVVEADDTARVRLAELAGARPLARRDLQSGWVPDDALGRVATWVAATDRQWALG